MSGQSMKQLLFDYDGTLHDSAAIYPPAFRKMYRKMVLDGVAPQREWADEEITCWLGYNAMDMWRDFMPNATPEQRDFYGAEIGREMIQTIRDGGARLYPHTLEVLEELKRRGYSMLILSNCKEEYLQAHRESFDFDQFFSGYYAAETYDFMPKHEIFSTIQMEHPGTFTVVGDRFHDMELARRNHLPAVGCRYGFGTESELDYAQHTIQDIRELLELFPGR
jgi:phosphoglycolate phosphatase